MIIWNSFFLIGFTGIVLSSCLRLSDSRDSTATNFSESIGKVRSMINWENSSVIVVQVESGENCYIDSLHDPELANFVSTAFQSRIDVHLTCHAAIEDFSGFRARKAHRAILAR